MGMVNFYRRFIPNAAKIMQPLFVALAGKPKDLQWNDAMVNAFQDSKTALADATMLTHPRRNAPTSLTQEHGQRWDLCVPPGYASGHARHRHTDSPRPRIDTPPQSCWCSSAAPGFSVLPAIRNPLPCVDTSPLATLHDFSVRYNLIAFMATPLF